MNPTQKESPLKAIERSIMDDFKQESNHLRTQSATQKMQEELLQIALPYHLKLQELGYQWQESLLVMRQAFNHQPHQRKSLPLTVFGK